ncbi:MAG: hypothetical protein M3Q98_08375 [Actinomycetota bacterium]|nr:hypothetical protein [Actinomycetota bacterium]
MSNFSEPIGFGQQLTKQLSGSAKSSVGMRPATTVNRSFNQIAAGSVNALGDLYDLVRVSVWKASRLITHDDAAAERATIASFVRVGKAPSMVPRDEAAARRWIVRAVCQIAESITAAQTRTPRQPAPSNARGPQL